MSFAETELFCFFFSSPSGDTEVTGRLEDAYIVHPCSRDGTAQGTGGLFHNGRIVLRIAQDSPLIALIGVFYGKSCRRAAWYNAGGEKGL